MRTFAQILLLLAATHLTTNCKEKSSTGDSSKESENIRVIAVKPGLAFRDKGDVQGKLIETIPYGEEVKFILEGETDANLLGLKGKWSNVEYKGKLGWLYSPLLKKRGEQLSFTIVNGVAVKSEDETSGEESDKFAIAKSGKLRWTRCPLGMIGVSEGCKDKPTLFQGSELMGKTTPCSELNLGGVSWRLPSIRELTSIKTSSMIATIANESAGAIIWSGESGSSGNEDIQYYIQLPDWQKNGSFAKDGYVLCVADE